MFDNDYTVDPEEMVDEPMSDVDLCAMHIDAVIDEKSQLDEFTRNDWVDIYSTLKDMQIIELENGLDFALVYENKLKDFYVNKCGLETESGVSFSVQIASMGIGKYALYEDVQAWHDAVSELDLDKYVPESGLSEFRSLYIDFAKMAQDVKDFGRTWSTDDNRIYNILIQGDYSSGLEPIEADMMSIENGEFVPWTKEELEAVRSDFISHFCEHVHDSLDGSDVRVVRGQISDKTLQGRPALDEETYNMISKDYIQWLKDYTAERAEANKTVGFGIDYSRQNADAGLDGFDALVKATSRDKTVVAEADGEKKVLEIETVADDKQDIIEY